MLGAHDPSVPTGVMATKRWVIAGAGKWQWRRSSRPGSRRHSFRPDAVSFLTDPLQFSCTRIAIKRLAQLDGCFGLRCVADDLSLGRNALTSINFDQNRQFAALFRRIFGLKRPKSRGAIDGGGSSFATNTLNKHSR